MPTDYSDAQKRLMQASFALGQAQRDMEDAERRFKEAIDAVELLEQQEIPNFREMRGILKPT